MSLWTVEVNVDEQALAEACGGTNNTDVGVDEMLLQEFDWCRESGVSVVSLSVKKLVQCDTCGKDVDKAEYEKGKGLCRECVDLLQ